MLVSMNQVAQLSQFLAVFDLQDFLVPILQASSPHQACREVQAAKDAAKGNYYSLAKTVHPDKGGSTQAFQAISRVYSEFMRFQLLPVQVVCPTCNGLGLIDNDSYEVQQHGSADTAEQGA